MSPLPVYKINEQGLPLSQNAANIINSNTTKRNEGQDRPMTKEQTNAFLEKAQNTLLIEASALMSLASSIMKEMSDPFQKAVEALYATKGRVVITGMGKSGHIGNKIAATLSSTGTPSFFVHPAEASHGDLGMITPQDTIIAMSNSGETSELSDIMGYAKRHHMPLIAFTSKPKSTLATLSDISLVLPAHKEACPHGLAPTTSSTLMIALGDALSMAVLEKRGFSAADFSLLHPGGKLGQRLTRVEKLMHEKKTLPLLFMDASMADALLQMTSKGFGCVGILDETQDLIGIITDGDLRRHMEGDLMGSSIKDVMTPRPKLISQSILAQEALTLMNDLGITCLFVRGSEDESDRRPIGILHVHDCLRAGLS